MTCPLNDFGHLSFGRIIPIHGEEHRCLMWWPGEDAVVWKKYWGELVPTEERFPLSADEVLYVDLERIVTKTGESQIDVFDRGTMELLDQAPDCHQFCGWINEALWVGVGYRDRVPELVVRNIQQDDELRIALDAWMGYEATPLFMDVDDNTVTIVLDLGAHNDDATRTTHTSIGVCIIDWVNGEMLSLSKADSLRGRVLCVASRESETETISVEQPATARRHLVTTSGLFRMTYSVDGIAIDPIFLTGMEWVTYDNSTQSIVFAKGYDFWRVRWQAGAIELEHVRKISTRIDYVMALVDGTIITGNYLELFAFNEYQSSYLEAIDRILSLRFSPQGEQLAVVGFTSSTLFNVSDAGVTQESHFNSTKVVALTPEGTLINFEYHVNLSGFGVSQFRDVAEEWPDRKWSRWYADPDQRGEILSSPYHFNREPFLSPDGRHALVPYSDTLIDAQGVHSLDIPEGIIQTLEDAFKDGIFLLRIEHETGGDTLCTINSNDYSVHVVELRLPEKTSLTSTVLLNEEQLLGFLDVWDAPRDAPKQLVTVSLDGEVVPVGNRAWPRVDYAIHTTLDRGYVAFLTTDGLVRLETDSWESETFSIPGFTDLDRWTTENIVWELTPQGDGIAWVKDATLYFTRFETSE